MLDPVARALLLRLAEDLDAEVLGPLSDALEELGDARAELVRACTRGRMSRAGAAYNGWGHAEWEWRLSEQEKQDCHAALRLFPEGPRWQIQIDETGRGRVVGPLWTTPAAG